MSAAESPVAELREPHHVARASRRDGGDLSNPLPVDEVERMFNGWPEEEVEPRRGLDLASSTAAQGGGEVLQ